MYSEDNADTLLFASATVLMLSRNIRDWTRPYTWCTGTMNFNAGNASNWDPTVDIYKSLMWPYCGKNLAIWHCPADRSKITVGGVQQSRLRSMAINAYLGGFGGQPIGEGNMGAYLLYLKYGQLSRPGPEKIFLFIDEREDAINYGNYLQDMSGYSPSSPPLYRWLDIPASYHGNACGLSFCDGHSPHSSASSTLSTRTSPPNISRRSSPSCWKASAGTTSSCSAMAYTLTPPARARRKRRSEEHT